MAWPFLRLWTGFAWKLPTPKAPARRRRRKRTKPAPKAGRLHLSLADDAIKETVRLLERKWDEADRVATHIKQLISAAP